MLDNFRLNLIKHTEKSWRRLRDMVGKRDKWTCQYCGRYVPKGQADHVLPLTKGGTDAIYNLVWACSTCNAQKGGKTLVEWMAGALRSQRQEVLAQIDALLKQTKIVSEDGLDPQLWFLVETGAAHIILQDLERAWRDLGGLSPELTYAIDLYRHRMLYDKVKDKNPESWEEYIVFMESLGTPKVPEMTDAYKAEIRAVVNKAYDEGPFGQLDLFS